MSTPTDAQAADAFRKQLDTMSIVRRAQGDHRGVYTSTVEFFFEGEAVQIIEPVSMPLTQYALERSAKKCDLRFEQWKEDKVSERFPSAPATEISAPVDMPAAAVPAGVPVEPVVVFAEPIAEVFPETKPAS